MMPELSMTATTAPLCDASVVFDLAGTFGVVAGCSVTAFGTA
jgi:hypothetical protein